MSGGFHAGEVKAQELAGVRASYGAIRDFMPDQHRIFFGERPFMLAATLDADGSPRARLLSGAPGFVDSPDPVTLRIAAETELRAGDAIGLLGLDFNTRRRNRANGVVRSNADGELMVTVLESFGNCPQHITVRDASAAQARPRTAHAFSGLDGREMIARADTFFVATTGGVHGVDISHRGGPPGFVSVEGDTLSVPDFNGNRYFNTLGNLLIDPRAALLFIDFDSGDVLELQGRAEILWNEGPALPGSQGGRGWRFRAERGVMLR